MKITVYYGANSEQELDRLRQHCGGSVFLKTAPNGWHLVAKFMDFFQKIQKETETGDRRPIFIYGFFDRIDEAIDIRTTIAALAALNRPVFVAVCSSYPKEKLQHENVRMLERESW